MRKKRASIYEKRLVELGIRQILARVKHSHTKGKLARFYGELQRKLFMFEDVAGPPGTGCPIGSEKIETDPVARFIRRYNYERSHDSLDWDSLETPFKAFHRKMPPKMEIEESS